MENGAYRGVVGSVKMMSLQISYMWRVRRRPPGLWSPCLEGSELLWQHKEDPHVISQGFLMLWLMGVELSVNLTCISLDLWEETGAPGENPHRHRSSMQTALNHAAVQLHMWL